MINKAGHMIPADQPIAFRTMIWDFVENTKNN